MPERIKIFYLSAFLTLAAARACAQELDSVLPAIIPGYGAPLSVARPGQGPGAPAGLQLGAFSIAPRLGARAGYDTAPNGAAGSSVLGLSPSVLMADAILGLGAYLAGDLTAYPQNSTQNTQNLTFAAGENYALPHGTATLAGAFLSAQETGFALTTAPAATPLGYTVKDLRLDLSLNSASMTLKPGFEADQFRFPDLAAQNRTDFREFLLLGYAPGGPLTLLARLQEAQSRYRVADQNADTDQLLLGLADTADGLWTISALAGVARRRPSTGPPLTAPVLEARLDWMPSRADEIRMTLRREIDDPDQISPTPYTLCAATLTADHQFPSRLRLKLSVTAEHAAYLSSPLRETLMLTATQISWPLTAALALEGQYDFNDRQANYLRAANEHVFTLGLTWTP